MILRKLMTSSSLSTVTSQRLVSSTRTKLLTQPTATPCVQSCASGRCIASYVESSDDASSPIVFNEILTNHSLFLMRQHRNFASSSTEATPTPTTSNTKSIVNISFLQPDGVTIKKVSATVGESLLRLAQRNEIDLEGACEGVCACSTCHLIFPVNVYDTLPEASEDEEDMLDMAFGLTETSRLGCQINVTQDMDGMLVTMPAATRNFYVDGHVPKPH